METYRQLLSKQLKDNLKTQLQELANNDTLIALLQNLHKLACCCLSLPISTASVERSFSQMKLIKTRLRNHLGEISLSHLMKIAIESPETLSDSDLRCVHTSTLIRIQSELIASALRTQKIAIRIHQSTYRVGFNLDSDGFNWISWGCGHS